MYIESTGQRPRDVARLISPSLPSTIKCLEFWYHMYGDSTEELNVYQRSTFSSQLGTPIWSQTGDQGDVWQQATINVVAVSNFNVVFEGVRGTSYRGDIAIDDVSFRSTPCNGGGVPNCNFDTTLCGYDQDITDDFDWTREQGSTQTSSTGPSSDHTTGSGYYMYIETSSPQAIGDVARLVTPSIPNDIKCLEFWYHMYGDHAEELNVYQRPTFSSQLGNPIWSQTGEQGNSWLQARVDLVATSSFCVIFEGVRGTSFRGDIAIDDVSFSSTSCVAAVGGGDCDFDTNVCSYQQDDTDDFDWTRQQGSTQSPSTGPSSDHTTGSGYYMYIEASGPQQRGDVARLISPVLSSDTRCLEFSYHMYGSDTKDLHVYLRPTDSFLQETLVWSQTGDQGDVWQQARVNLVAANNFNIVFEGVRGNDFRGDIAIDDVTFRTTSCDGTPTTTPDTCGNPTDLTTDTAMFTSPNYGISNYPDDSSCSWMIISPIGTRILLSFSSFSLEPYTGCVYDYVTVYDGDSESSSSINCDNDYNDGYNTPTYNYHSYEYSDNSRIDYNTCNNNTRNNDAITINNTQGAVHRKCNNGHTIFNNPHNDNNNTVCYNTRIYSSRKNDDPRCFDSYCSS
ncbi:MAMDC2 [Branchiostoma lanceolatum]|uniref:MAMDC2 protein n=1 Tax=Branchiostoma lanceolatum TaxID=7740 RepID=A0A8K0AJ53_BRALA|nr:MAMDC2 [Branchiostoma lanceolatum]